MGFLASYVTVAEMSEGLLKIVLLILFLSVSIIGSMYFLISQLSLITALPNLLMLTKLGIKKIYGNGIAPNMSRKIASSKEIRIMAVSANVLITNMKNEIIEALHEQRALIRVLLAEPHSEFVLDIEEVESETRSGHISPEIERVKSLLQEYAKEVGKYSGNIQLAYYSTQLRFSIILCDNNWGWVTLNIPPKRAVQSISFEIYAKEAGLFSDFAKHFDKVWHIMEERNQVVNIT
jgi:hypothetical protein